MNIKNHVYEFHYSVLYRCYWKGEERLRQELCSPSSFHVLGPPGIHLTFTRSRRRMVTGNISRRRYYVPYNDKKRHL